MGCVPISCSRKLFKKKESCEALRVCKERKEFIKKAIDSRYDFAAAHRSYLQSLHNFGISLSRFSEAHVLVDPCGTIGDGGGGPSESINSYSCMRSSGTNAASVAVKATSSDVGITPLYQNDVGSISFTKQLSPQLSPRASGSSSNFGFVHYEELVNESVAVKATSSDVGINPLYQNDVGSISFTKQLSPQLSPGASGSSSNFGFVHHGELVNESNVRSPESVTNFEITEVGSLKSDNQSDEGGSAFIRRAEGDKEDVAKHKDFLSTIKDIEILFFRASQQGRDVSRMLESDKIIAGYCEAKGGSSASSLLCANCCIGKTALVSLEPPNVTKAIKWKRSTSSLSSSLRTALASTSKEDNDDSGSDVMGESCMIAGSHSSTLDRLNEWERKLYDEVKASESIRKEYDKKCDQFKHTYAKDLKIYMIDKTRSLVEDPRIIVALDSVDDISKRIDKMRDEELQPQLLELIHGLNRMWKSMRECHDAQYYSISASHLNKSNNGIQKDESKKQIMDELQGAIECFVLSFTNMVNSQISYIESINNWLQSCSIQPKELLKTRALSLQRHVTPPLLVISSDWSSAIQTLPAQHLRDAIKAFLSTMKNNYKYEETMNTSEAPLNLLSMRSSLRTVLKRLTKFSEASVKMYEDIKQRASTI